MPRHSYLRTTLFLSVLSLLALFSSPARAQEEIVANLAAGRVVIDVARDGIVIGAIEQHVEADSRPPLVFPIDDRRICILPRPAHWPLPPTALTSPPLHPLPPRI